MDFKKYKIESPKDLMNFFEKNMKYGFKYRNQIFTEDNPDFQKEMDKVYKLRLGEDFIKSGYGVCWDFCELERLFFLSKNISHECYFLESFINREEGGPTHTFALFKQNNKWCWFEYSWFAERGIWEYNSHEEALKDIVKKFKEFCNQVGQVSNVGLYRTKKFNRRLNTYEFVEQCLNSEKIELGTKKKNEVSTF